MEEIKVFLDINKDIKDLRYEVFCVEQKIDEKEEWDNLDKDRYHFCLYVDGILVSYCRCFIDNGSIHIGRVITKKAFRLQGYGSKIIKYAENYLYKISNTFILNSQHTAVKFYESLGYKICSDIFLDAGIPHYQMKKVLKVLNK